MTWFAPQRGYGCEIWSLPGCCCLEGRLGLHVAAAVSWVLPRPSAAILKCLPNLRLSVRCLEQEVRKRAVHRHELPQCKAGPTWLEHTGAHFGRCVRYALMLQMCVSPRHCPGVHMQGLLSQCQCKAGRCGKPARPYQVSRTALNHT